ncbi:pks3 [Symbiodinium pilosum]|uniref:Pks3 protein n=1 Tax=Symbiodinium pilosum TaxID=2952 RepID=A0A812SHT1_SYMPI|nr:pks3 [Symbiodinium pilosum]
MLVFTLEVVVDHIQGWEQLLQRCAPMARHFEMRHPALALRFLDLEPAIVQADAITETSSELLNFHGRGKAMVLELPCGMLEETLPLWLMALALQPAEADSGARRATLLASACINLQQEVARANSPPACSAPTVFRRSCFRMTSAHKSLPDLQLACYMRVYAGAHQPFAGEELLLEPVALPVAGQEEPELDLHRHCHAETQTEVESEVPGLVPIAPPPAAAPASSKLQSQGAGRAMCPARVMEASELRKLEGDACARPCFSLMRFSLPTWACQTLCQMRDRRSSQPSLFQRSRRPCVIKALPYPPPCRWYRNWCAS